MSYVNEITVTFTLSDGRELQAQWRETVHPATFDSAEEGDADEATYYLDGKEIALCELPQGLDAIAELMYDDRDSDKRFTVHVREMSLRDARSPE